MALEQKENVSSQEELSSAETQFFGMADVEGVLDDLGGEPNILREIWASMTYEYNKVSIAWINNEYIDKVIDAVKVDNEVRRAVAAWEQPKIPVGAKWLSSIIISPRANAETVNLARLDIDSDSWNNYVSESQVYLELHNLPISEEKINDPRFKNNFALAYARWQELKKHLKAQWYQGEIIINAPSVVFKTEEMSNEEYKKVPGLKITAEYRVKQSTVEVSWEKNNSINGKPVIYFGESDYIIEAFDEQWRPSVLRDFNNHVINIHTKDYAAWEFWASGKKEIPLVEFKEAYKDEEKVTRVRTVRKYIDFGQDPSNLWSVKQNQW